ncbi:hypothetical protein HRI_002642100 [Hibiscus trionum]|uniref:Reverse transcriptase n=1 Tax=Hibiscus trionum TaxID=183268 RepID=A0A9W7I6B3_HIBTR|nr:hypothetical protein HRI_002642100 [Hibiscus trionum]
MQDFREALFDCDLADLGYEWNWYTWERGRIPATNIRERLDRGVSNPAWRALFPQFSVQHLTHTISDHCLVLVNTTPSQGDAQIRRSFSRKLKKLAGRIKLWSHDLKSSKTAKKASLNVKLAKLSLQDPDDESLAQLLDVKIALNMEADKDEIF